jgi:hypothetical protein
MLLIDESVIETYRSPPCRFLLYGFKSNRIFRASPDEFLDGHEICRECTKADKRGTTELAPKRRIKTLQL